MARRIVVEFLGKDVSAGSTASKVEQKFGKLGGKMDRLGQQAGKLLAGGLVVGGAAMVKFGQQAGDLAETQSKVNQIFGNEGAAALDKFAGTAARSLGQSKQTALDAASTFGVFGKSAGLAGDDLVGFSTDMTKLATDMASFNNTSPEEAIDAIGAALRGESEPIRSYGVLLDDATLRNEALRLGLIKTTKQALTPQQKVLAAQAAILKQTKDQQGDFARTSDGMANKQRILKAELANMTTELGTRALPIMTKAAEVGSKMLAWASEHSTTVKVLAGVIVGLVTTVWGISAAMRAWAAATAAWSAVTKIATAAQWLLNAAMTANPIGLVVVAIVALIAIFVIAYKKSETFRNIVNGAFGAIADKARAVAGWVKSHFLGMVNFVVTLPARIRAIAARMWNWISEKAREHAQWVRGRFDALVGFVRGLPGRISRAASGMFNGIRNAFRGAINWIIGKWNGLHFSLPSVSVPGFGKVGGGTLHTPDLPYLARGGDVRRSGGVVVGDAGPEILQLPKGARVTPLAQTSGGGDFEGTVRLDLMLDGETIQQMLLRLKRRRGGIELGIA